MKWIARKLLKLAVKLYFFVDKESYCFHIGTKHPNYDYTVTKNTYQKVGGKMKEFFITTLFIILFSIGLTSYAMLFIFLEKLVDFIFERKDKK